MCDCASQRSTSKVERSFQSAQLVTLKLPHPTSTSHITIYKIEQLAQQIGTPALFHHSPYPKAARICSMYTVQSFHVATIMEIAYTYHDTHKPSKYMHLQINRSLQFTLCIGLYLFCCFVFYLKCFMNINHTRTKVQTVESKKLKETSFCIYIHTSMQIQANNYFLLHMPASVSAKLHKPQLQNELSKKKN